MTGRPPQLVIILPLEGTPAFYLQAENEGEQLRLQEDLNRRAPGLFEEIEHLQHWNEAA